MQHSLLMMNSFSEIATGTGSSSGILGDETYRPNATFTSVDPDTTNDGFYNSNHGVNVSFVFAGIIFWLSIMACSCYMVCYFFHRKYKKKNFEIQGNETTAV